MENFEKLKQPSKQASLNQLWVRVGWSTSEDKSSSSGNLTSCDVPRHWESPASWVIVVFFYQKDQFWLTTLHSLSARRPVAESFLLIVDKWGAKNAKEDMGITMDLFVVGLIPSHHKFQYSFLETSQVCGQIQIHHGRLRYRNTKHSGWIVI